MDVINILLPHFQYPDSKNRNGYPVDPDIFFSSSLLWLNKLTPICATQQ